MTKYEIYYPKTKNKTKPVQIESSKINYEQMKR